MIEQTERKRFLIGHRPELAEWIEATFGIEARRIMGATIEISPDDVVVAVVRVVATDDMLSRPFPAIREVGS